MGAGMKAYEWYRGSKNGWLHPSNSVGDAERVAEKLEAKRFEVTPPTNSDAVAFETQVEDLCTDKANHPQALVFIWFSPSHGLALSRYSDQGSRDKKPTSETWGFWGQLSTPDDIRMTSTPECVG